MHKGPHRRPPTQDSTTETTEKHLPRGKEGRVQSPQQVAATCHSNHKQQTSQGHKSFMERPTRQEEQQVERQGQAGRHSSGVRE